MFFSLYSPILIILSVSIGITSSYTALALFERMFDSTRIKKVTWVLLGSLIMGMGIFLMHFVGMMASHINLIMSYNPALLAVALITSIIFSFVAFYIPYAQPHSKSKVILSGLVNGTGIVLTHYISFSAISGLLTIQYNSVYFTLSILIAMIFSLIASKVFFATKKNQNSIFRKISSAVSLGLAISLMHYTGMKVILFEPHSHHVLPGINPFTLSLIVSAMCLLL